ncbi:unnamed protein product [Mytilus edulis]|uniref:Uncharacterized protein n=1 Tax=Mytilus edulis TaxID=6550 RepID=A0A8S3VLT5_MYTED|nr:unnamed protein product [Mytilus edulis]
MSKVRVENSLYLCPRSELRIPCVNVQGQSWESPVFMSKVRAKNSLCSCPTPELRKHLCSCSRSELRIPCVYVQRKSWESPVFMYEERFEHPVPSHQLQEQGIAMKCRESQQEFKPYALTIQKEVVKLSETKIFSGGVISPQTITNFRKELSQLYGFC